MSLALEFVELVANRLNSDILAEMPLPQSGVSRYETFMNNHLPSGIHVSEEEHGVYRTDQDIKSVEVIYYWAQIQLRITLNSAHAALYKGGETPSEYTLTHCIALRYLSFLRKALADRLQDCSSGLNRPLMENLDAWREFTSQTTPELAWDDDDFLTSDINAARMRAKYYGAKVIINRPTLYAALHHDWSEISVRQSESPFTSQGRLSQQPSPTVPYKYHTPGMQRQENYVGSPGQQELPSIEKLKPEILNGVKACIHAAIRSTRAFDGVPPRLIVTNIFGTGHAYVYPSSVTMMEY